MPDRRWRRSSSSSAEPRSLTISSIWIDTDPKFGRGYSSGRHQPDSRSRHRPGQRRTPIPGSGPVPVAPSATGEEAHVDRPGQHRSRPGRTPRPGRLLACVDYGVVSDDSTGRKPWSAIQFWFMVPLSPARSEAYEPQLPYPSSVWNCWMLLARSVPKPPGVRRGRHGSGRNGERRDRGAEDDELAHYLPPVFAGNHCDSPDELSVYFSHLARWTNWVNSSACS